MDPETSSTDPTSQQQSRQLDAAAASPPPSAVASAPSPPRDTASASISLGCGSPTTTAMANGNHKTAASSSPPAASASTTPAATATKSSVVASPKSAKTTGSPAAATATKNLPANAAASLSSAASSAPPMATFTLPPLSRTISTTLQHHHLPASAHGNPLPPINLSINTTTGGSFGVTVDPYISVENLKKIIAKKLKVAKDRICLLHREKELQDGNLKDNNLMDGSKIILIPNVETGLLAQRPENTVMQALESLNDSQVNDFLSGKTPLNLSMRLGDHMMLIQLQLSTVNPANASGSGSGCSSSRTRSSQRHSRSSSLQAGGPGSASAAAAGGHHQHHSHHHHHHHHHHSGRKTAEGAANGDATSSSSRGSAAVASGSGGQQRISASGLKKADLSTLLSKRDYESLQNIVKSMALAHPGARLAAAQVPTNLSATAATAPAATAVKPGPSSSFHNPAGGATPPDTHNPLLEQSPIKSLSNLVSSPIKTAAIKHIPIVNGSSSSSGSAAAAVSGASGSSASQPSSSSSMPIDPIAAKLTSCLCTRLNAAGVLPPRNCLDTSCQTRQDGQPPQHSAHSHAHSHNQPHHHHHHHNHQQARTSHGSSVLTSTPIGGSSKSTVAVGPDTPLLHKTANNPITRSKHRHHHHHHHHHHHYHHASVAGGAAAASTPVARPKAAATSSRASSNDSGFLSEDSGVHAPVAAVPQPQAVVATATGGAAAATTVDLDDSGITVSDTRTLAEASRNLTQTLRKLSKEVFTNKIDLSSADAETPRKSGSGAVIESMKNHGKGIYSGTFSGTLNPALQDRYGRPKRDISTVIHILNDLLSATPQYSRGAKISFEAPSTSGAAQAASGSAASGSGSSSRSKQMSSRHHHGCVKCIKAAAAMPAPHQSCTYGECSGHYSSSKASSSSSSSQKVYACCQDLTAAASGGSTTLTPGGALGDERHTCACRYRLTGEGGEREREFTCQKCSHELENQKTKSKLDQLRLVMQQRKQKREARKAKCAPYDGAARVAASGSVAVADANAIAAVAASEAGESSPAMTGAGAKALTAPAQEVSPNHIVEEVDTAA